MNLILFTIATICLTTWNIRCCYMYCPDYPKWLESLYSLNVICIAVIWIQLLGVEAGITLAALGFAPFWWWSRRRVNAGNMHKKSMTYQLASTFPFLFIIFFVRAFIIQPYRIPSGSLAPTVHIGDFIVANQFIYGPRLPISHKRIFEYQHPKTGDIVLFHWPKNPKVVFVKRVIGLPGDHISYHHHQLTINGKLLPHRFVRNTVFSNRYNQSTPVKQFIETLPNKMNHYIYQNINSLHETDGDWVVPKNHYFVMGDNRDNSNDSRFWGTVPEHDLVGKALFVWMNFNTPALFRHDWKNLILWHRFGQGFHL